MKPEAANMRIKAFVECFGTAHKHLAFHAALPLAVTPDLLYCLWANFQRDVQGTPLGIPWVAVADLLLSRLCSEVSVETYEMEKVVRDELLSQLRADPRFGPQRVKELADFLSDYVRQQLYTDDPDIRDFAQAQQWTALAYTRPDEAAYQVASTLAGLSPQNQDEHIRMASVVEAFSEPLSEYVPLIEYARGMATLSRGDLARATSHFNRAAPQGSKAVSIAHVTLTIPTFTTTAAPVTRPQQPAPVSAPDRATTSVLMTYSIANDVMLNQKLSLLRQLLGSELRQQTDEEFEILTSVSESETVRIEREQPHTISRQAIEKALICIPVITPDLFESPRCRYEISQFLSREKRLKQRLIFPIYVVQAPQMENEYAQDEIADALRSRYWLDFLRLRNQETTSPQFLDSIGRLVAAIRETVVRLSNLPAETDQTVAEPLPVTESITNRSAVVSEAPEVEAGPIAFVSYSSVDNPQSEVSYLMEYLNNEVGVRTGLAASLSWDTRVLAPGDAWEELLQEAREAAKLLIPIVTPAYFESDFCRRELWMFLEREKQLENHQLIFPVYYMTVPWIERVIALKPDHPVLQTIDPLIKAIVSRPFLDLRVGPYSPEMAKKVDDFAARIAAAAHRLSTNQQTIQLSQNLQRRVEALRGTNLFTGLSEEQLNDLAVLTKVISFEEGQVISHEGAVDPNLYIVAEGILEARIKSADGDSKGVVGILGKGHYSGEMALFTGERRTATLVARTQSECYVLDKTALDLILRHYPSIVADISHLLASRQIDTEEVSEGRLDEDARQDRMRHMQNDLSERIGKYFGLAPGSEPSEASSTKSKRDGDKESRQEGSLEADLVDAIEGVSEEPATQPAAREGDLLALISKVGITLLASSTLNEALETIVDLVFEAVPADRCLLMMRDEATEELKVAAGRLRDRAGEVGEIRVSRNVMDEAVLRGKSVLTSDAQVDPHFSSGTSVIQGVKSVLVVPLAVSEKVLGIIYADSPISEVKFTEDHLKVLTTLASVAAIRVENARLAERQLEVLGRERLERELQIASEMQQRLLPASLPVVAGYELQAISFPCYEVGCDYYDFIQRDDNRLIIALGEVSGKGTAAALLMSSLHAAIHSHTGSHDTVAKTISAVNRYLSDNIPPNRFVTLFYAELDPRPGTLSFLNAGHSPPLLVRALGTVEQLASGGLPLGIKADAEFREGQTKLNSGDVLVIYSDGVSEATNPAGEEFGPTRLYEVIERNLDASAAGIRDRIEAALTKFCQGTPAADDITLVIVKRLKLG